MGFRWVNLHHYTVEALIGPAGEELEIVPATSADGRAEAHIEMIPYGYMAP